MSFLSWLGHLFTDLFNKIEKLYHSLTDAEQNAVKVASGIVAVINQNLNETPDVVWELIQKAYPSVTKDAVTTVLNNVAKTIGVLEKDATLLGAIISLQDYLRQFEGNKWVAITKNIVTLIVNELQPSTVIQKIVLVLDFVYENFVKGKV